MRDTRELESLWRKRAALVVGSDIVVDHRDFPVVSIAVLVGVGEFVAVGTVTAVARSR